MPTRYFARLYKSDRLTGHNTAMQWWAAPLAVVLALGIVAWVFLLYLWF